MTTTNALVKHCYGTAASWTSNDPILLAGEVGWESDTGKAKLGDGTSHWTALSYAVDFVPTSGLLDSTTTAVDSSTPGQIKWHNITPAGVHGSFGTDDGTTFSSTIYIPVFVPYGFTITGAYAMGTNSSGAANSCSMTAEVWCKARAIPTVSDKISASAPITLSSASYSSDTTLTGWSKTVTALSVMIFKCVPTASCQRVQFGVFGVPTSS